MEVGRWNIEECKNALVFLIPYSKFHIPDSAPQ